MKLYATVTSERATKGQGGNKYLDIKITDNTGDEFLTVKIIHTNTIQETPPLLEYQILVKNRNIVLVNRSHWIKETKGNQQKGNN